MKLPKLAHLLPAKVTYAKTRLAHKVTLAAVYVSIAALIIIVAALLGSRIVTRSLPSGNIELSVPYSHYLVGDEITFTVKNNFNSPIYFPNNCPGEPLYVYRYENQQWVRIHDNAKVNDCYTENRQIVVGAHSSASGNFNAWHHLFDQPGKYRIVAYVEYYGSLPYQDFEVVTKPIAPAIPALIPPKTIATTQPSTSTRSSSSTTNQSTTTNPSTPSTTTRQSKTITITGGTVSVQYDATTVYVMSITPAAGYTYEGGRSGAQVEITFIGKGNQIQLQLYVQNGQLIQHVENGG